MSLRENQTRYKARAEKLPSGNMVDMLHDPEKSPHYYVQMRFRILDANSRHGQTIDARFCLYAWDDQISDFVFVEYTAEKLANAGFDRAKLDLVNFTGVGSIDCVIVVEDKESDRGTRYSVVKFVNEAWKEPEQQRMAAPAKNAVAQRMQGLARSWAATSMSAPPRTFTQAPQTNRASGRSAPPPGNTFEGGPDYAGDDDIPF